jgi:NAD(P)H-hydrate repair Nnr-like enzyme with NAD(P)H-hydrate dehydratase domain
MAREIGALDRVLSHDGPIVLDADALSPDVLDRVSDRSEPTVLTPHSGELERLTAKAPSWQVAAELADAAGAIVVFKGNPTFVCGPGVPNVITSNGPELASIGTGDVLAGMVSAVIARGMEPVAGAAAAAHWHGVAAADLASQRTVTADVLAGFVGRYAGTLR